MFAWARGYTHVWCESDSKHAAHLITSKSWQRYHSCAIVLEDIRALLARDWRVRFTHVWREGNRCADEMARIGCQENGRVKFWETPPSSMLLMLQEDSQCVL